MNFLVNLHRMDVGQTYSDAEGLLAPAKQFILDHFGQNGLYAAYALGVAIILIILYKLVKVGFEVVFFVAIPSVLAAFVLTFVLPYNFIYLLPATTALFTLGLVLRTVAFAKG